MKYFYMFLAKILRVSPEVISFISDNRSRYLKKLAIILPLTAWTSFLYQIYPIFIKFQVDALTEKWTDFGNIFGSKSTSGFSNLNLNNTLNGTFEVFASIVLLVLVLQSLDSVLKYWKDNVLDLLNQQSDAYLEDKFNNFLTKFDSSFLASENNLRLIRNLQYNFDGLENKINSLLTTGIDLVVSLITIVTILPFIHPLLLSLIVLSVILNMGLDLLQNNAWRRFELVGTRKNDVRSEIRWRLVWHFNRILTNGWIDQLYANYKVRRCEWFELKYKQSNLDRRYELAKNLLNNALQALSSMIAAWLVIQKYIQIGTFVVFDLYISRIKGFLQNIGSIFRTIVELRFELFRIDFLLKIKPKLDYNNIQQFSAADIEKIQIQNLNFTYPKFFTEEIDYFKQMQARLGLLGLEDVKAPDIAETSNTKISFIRIWLFKAWTTITKNSINQWEKAQLKKEFEEIEKIFQKANQNKPILKNLSVEFNKGQIYALVGYNGAGKTTFTKLLKRSIDPTSGDILIDGHSLKHIDPLAWKSYISGLEQETFVWDSFSIRENLNLGNPTGVQFSDEQLWAALDKVGLKSAINDLDVTYSEGIELSGGQNQLLEIARIYLQKKPIVILDEGTNQLDALKENQILNLLHEIKQNSIVIFITHRMTTCSRCDQILVLDEGQLIEQGTHTKLLNESKPNLYQKFWKMQVEGQA